LILFRNFQVDDLIYHLPWFYIVGLRLLFSAGRIVSTSPQVLSPDNGSYRQTYRYNPLSVFRIYTGSTCICKGEFFMPDSRYQRLTLHPVVLAFALLLLFNRMGRAEWVQTLTADVPRTPKIFALTVAGPYLLAGFESGVFRSPDQGDTWIHPSIGLSGSTTVFSLATRGSTVFAGTVGGGVYRSTNYGLDWTQAGLMGEYIVSIVPSEVALLAVTCCNGAFRSVDDGATWIRSVAEGANINVIAASGAFLFGGTERGLYRSSDNGVSWTHVPFAAGLSDSAVGPVAALGTALFASARQTLYRSDDNGGTWTKTPMEEAYIRVLTASDRDLFLVSDRGLFRSSDRGGSWVRIDSGLASSLRYPPSIFCLAVGGGNLFAGVSQAGVWRRPLSEIGTAILSTRAFGSKVNSGYRGYPRTPGFIPGMAGILQTGPTTGFHVNGRPIALSERLLPLVGSPLPK
jgi:photosystem II stability/assembly factor-like uncharacterized protein